MNSRVGSREYDRFTDRVVFLIIVGFALIPWFIAATEIILS